MPSMRHDNVMGPLHAGAMAKQHRGKYWRVFAGALRFPHSPLPVSLRLPRVFRLQNERSDGW